ncbi:TetR/AcrR family transcriptional regulator [Oricola indica]|uniref:TetR/AcrR family transcriptional regulator n=1 Tax=Oricola indica TaxID=2872591 RepID=UPI001CC0B14D|nr:TetR/AcrR family transcriptional regulator [Oricola indica]
MKAQIRDATIDLLIMNGYRGTNFRLIAERLGITTTNIHYHFGGKASLVLDVVSNYVEDAIQRQRGVWMRPNTTLKDKLQLASGLNRQRYLRYNPGENTNQPWSLIWRLRMEQEALIPETVACLESYTTHLSGFIGNAVQAAAASGELAGHAPLDNITTLLTSLANSAAAVALDSGWPQLEALYAATAAVVFSAYCPTPDLAGVAK